VIQSKIRPFQNPDYIDLGRTATSIPISCAAVNPLALATATRKMLRWLAALRYIDRG
jgi:hypothetical protein